MLKISFRHLCLFVFFFLSKEGCVEVIRYHGLFFKKKLMQHANDVLKKRKIIVGSNILELWPQVRKVN